MKFYEDKTVWIIGGTSGIGLALAQKLAKAEGCSVIISGRDPSKAKEINAEKISLDVCNHKVFMQAYETVFTRFQKIDIIIFCAGTYYPMGLKNYDREKSLDILNTNLASMANFIDAISKNITAYKPKMIGIVSSVAGYFGMPNSLFYGASKAGLSHLTESLHIELKKYGVDVKLINPGFVKTSLTDKNHFKMPFIISPEEAADIILKKFPKGKFEIAFPSIFVLLLKLFKKIPFNIRVSILQNKY